MSFEILLYEKKMSYHILNEGRGCTHLTTFVTKFGDLVSPNVF